MKERFNEIKREFLASLKTLGFQEWDIDADCKQKHYYECKTPRNRGIFVELFHEGYANSRTGNINLYFNPLSNPHEYNPSDHLVNILMEHTLSSIGIPLVIGFIEGANRGKIRPLYHQLNQDNPGVVMADCDQRSLIDNYEKEAFCTTNKTKPLTKLIEEIKYFRDMFIKIEANAESLAPLIHKLIKNYPIITPPSIDRRC